MASRATSVLFKALNFYNYSLWKYPLRTSCCTAGTIYACGDYVCQIFIERDKQKWDPEKEGSSYWRPKFDRMAKMTVVGFLINGPFAKFWYHDVQPYYIKNIIPKTSRNAQTTAIPGTCASKDYHSTRISMINSLARRMYSSFLAL